MSDQDQSKKFRPRARLLLQLGDQLIRSENIAVVELVKNAYDADAPSCSILCRDIDDPELGEIVIQDDGSGMTPDIIKNVWLEPGADFKEQILNQGDQVSFDFALTLPRRTPIGEKGVGRFGAHKLGDSIELITKSKDSKKEVIIAIDWKDFLKERYLDETTFTVTERTPKVFTDGKSGTRIRIGALRKTWNEKTFQDLAKSILSLASPFEMHDNFSVNLTLELRDKKKQEKWSAQEISAEKIRDAALWELDCTLENDEITSFDLYFKPWKTMGIEPHRISLDNLVSSQRHKLKRKVGRTSESIDLSKHKIGKVRIQAFLFDLDVETLKHSPLLPAYAKDYLSQNGGVRVYRDNMRIYDYGEQGNDWLDLDKKRINDPSRQIGNRNILGAIMLDRKTSGSLVEKTNREGFVEGGAYADFSQAIRYVIDLIAGERIEDKSKMRRKKNESPRSQPVTHDIRELKKQITDRLSDVEMDDKESFVNDVSVSLDRIQEQYINTNEVLIKSSNLGLSLGVVIHEVEKRVDELKKAVSSKSLDAGRIRELVGGIATLVDGYSALATNDKKIASLKKAIDVSLINVEFRFIAHGVEVIKAYQKSPDMKVPYSLNSVVGMLLNLYDNSIYWLHSHDVQRRRIFIDVKDYGDEFGVIVADNGNGFDLEFEDAVQPFVTHKPVGGIGLGLHIVDEVMKAHHGTLLLRSSKEVDNIPDEFSNGAIIELLFKVKQDGPKKPSES